MNRREALCIDNAFYVDFEADIAMWCVFGDESGFCYGVYVTRDETCEAMGVITFP